MFGTEFKVTGMLVNGQIIGNWSKDSEFALKLSKLEFTTLGEKDLDRLIDELVIIRDKVCKLNIEHKSQLR